MNSLVVVQQVRQARTVSWSPTLALFSLSLPHQSVCASEVSHVRLPAYCTHLDAAGLIMVDLLKMEAFPQLLLDCCTTCSIAAWLLALCVLTCLSAVPNHQSLIQKTS